MSDKTNYTAEDIKLYLEGKMSPEQMHALEKAALSDPFLADALEGMEVHGDTQKFNTEVEELRARLAGRAQRKKGALASVSSLWWKIAAVLIIVITGVAIIIFTGENNKTAQNEIAKTENDKKVYKNEEGIKPQAAQSESAKLPEPADTTKQETVVPKRKQKQEPVTKLKEPVAAHDAEAEAIQNLEEINVQRDVSSIKKPSASARPSADSVSRVLEGKVAGIAANRSEEPDSMFDEVIVVGYGSSNKKNSRSKTVSAGRAERRVIPGKGWAEFEQYIEDSTKINTADSVYTGEEHLSFTIGNDGLPESIKILRSISPTHDKEAIRLLQNGPSWKVAKGRKREIRLKIIF